MTGPVSQKPVPQKPTPKAGILEISPYVPGKAAAEGIENPVKMSANENALGCSEAARAAYLEAAGRLNLYPDPRATRLRAAIAARYGLEPERLIFGCGSDEIFALIADTFLAPGDNAVQGQYGFSAFSIATRKEGAEIRSAPEPNFTVDVDELLKRVDERTKIVWLANPANPTGTMIGGEEVRRLHAALPPNVILVLDGAYREFAADVPDFEDGVDLVRRHGNVVMTRTFSKLHGLPGLRVGWAYAHEDVVGAMDRIRLPFNVNIPALAAAEAALADEAFQARSLALVEQWRPWLTQQLGGLGLEVTPSKANFVLVHFPATLGRTALEAEAHLARQGLLVRSTAPYGLPDALRITIGLEEHNRALVEALAGFMGR